MNTPNNLDTGDQGLRRLLAQADPAIGAAPSPELLDRIRTEARDAAFEAPLTSQTPANVDREAWAPSPTAPGPAVARPSFVRRHWQGLVLAAASVATLALASGVIVPGLLNNAGSDSATSGARTSVETSDAAGAALAKGRSTTATPTAASSAPQYLVRSGSLLVGTDSVTAARDSFVASVVAVGGRVTSETIVTAGASSGPGIGVVGANAGSDVAYPYPYPSGPGVWLTVEVPAKSYESTIAAARKLGEVVQMQQSSYDVGAQVADVDARVAALESSLARLKSLMNRAKNVSDVIDVEKAISDRQADLDSLKAQQRELADQTSMSRISLALMSPEDARDAVNPQPHKSWWESFLEGLGQLWAWLGQALLIASPLVFAGGIVVWVRRRQRRRRAGGATTDASSTT